VAHHGEQAVRVTGLGRQDDAAPGGVEPDRAEAVILGVAQLLKMQARIGSIGELAEGWTACTMSCSASPNTT
jgi:hypothetical protein